MQWVVPDEHGTTLATIDAGNLSVNKRWQDPFGNLRGTPPQSWPDKHGFVGGYNEVTGLTHLGARDYDPTTGRFTQPDPLMSEDNPQQWNGYAYAGNAPTTNSDPQGLNWSNCGPDGVGCGGIEGDDPQGPDPVEKKAWQDTYLAGDDIQRAWQDIYTGIEEATADAAYHPSCGRACMERGGGERHASEPLNGVQLMAYNLTRELLAKSDDRRGLEILKWTGLAVAAVGAVVCIVATEGGCLAVIGEAAVEGGALGGTTGAVTGAATAAAAEGGGATAGLAGGLTAEGAELGKGAGGEGEAAGTGATAPHASPDAADAAEIFRNVDPTEFDSIAATGKFGTGEGQMEGKWFATEGEHADRWGELLNDGQGLTVRTRIPRSLADQLHHHAGKLDGVGPAYYSDGDQLAQINDQMSGIELWP